MVFVTEVHMVDGAKHKHIAAVKWENPFNGEIGSSSRAEMVEFIGTNSGDARVRNGKLEVKMGVITLKTGAKCVVLTPTVNGLTTS